MALHDFFGLTRKSPYRIADEAADELGSLGQILTTSTKAAMVAAQSDALAAQAEKIRDHMRHAATVVPREVTAEDLALKDEMDRGTAVELLRQTQSSNDQKLASVISTLLNQLKCFQPSPLAKVLARDPVLMDLLSKALMLAPAYVPDPSKD